MDEKQMQPNDDQSMQERNFSVISISEDQAPEVLEFIARLRSEDSDVQGHMLNRGLIGGSAFGQLSLSFTMETHTGCGPEHASKVGFDIDCTDTDKQTHQD